VACRLIGNQQIGFYVDAIDTFSKPLACGQSAAVVDMQNERISQADQCSVGITKN
jgi:hypothetical protein